MNFNKKPSLTLDNIKNIPSFQDLPNISIILPFLNSVEDHDYKFHQSYYQNSKNSLNSEANEYKGIKQEDIKYIEDLHSRPYGMGRKMDMEEVTHHIEQPINLPKSPHPSGQDIQPSESNMSNVVTSKYEFSVWPTDEGTYYTKYVSNSGGTLNAYFNSTLYRKEHRISVRDLNVKKSLEYLNEYYGVDFNKIDYNALDINDRILFCKDGTKIKVNDSIKPDVIHSNSKVGDIRNRIAKKDSLQIIKHHNDSSMEKYNDYIQIRDNGGLKNKEYLASNNFKKYKINMKNISNKKVRYESIIKNNYLDLINKESLNSTYKSIKKETKNLLKPKKKIYEASNVISKSIINPNTNEIINLYNY